MDWSLGNRRDRTVVITCGFPVKGRESWVALRPYSPCVVGLAQFAAILLKFPEVMERFNSAGSLFTGIKPTQGNMLTQCLKRGARRKAKYLEGQIAICEKLKDTAVQEAADCERFLSDLKAPKIASAMLDDFTLE